MISFQSFVILIYFLLIPLDGLFRFIAYKFNLYLLNGWKDFYLLAILYFGFIIYFMEAINGVEKRKIQLLNIALIVIIGGVLGILWGFVLGSTGFMQGLWGFKILYLPVFLFILLQVFPMRLQSEFFENLVKKLLIISVPIIIIGVWQFLIGWQRVSQFFLNQEIMGGTSVKVVTIGGYLRAFSTLREAYVFGDFCFMMILFNYSLLTFSRRADNKIYFLTLFALIIGLIVSTSRTSMLSSIIGCLILFFLRHASGNLRETKKRFIHSYTLVFLFFLLLIFFLAFIYKIPELNFKFGKVYLNNTSIIARLKEWSDVLKQFPLYELPRFFFGWGTGVVGAAQGRLFYGYHAVDNFYVYILVMHGLSGLVLWFFFLISILGRMLEFVGNTSNREYSSYWFMCGVFAIVATKILGFIFSTGLEAFPGQIYFWGFIGFALRHLSQVSHYENKT